MGTGRTACTHAFGLHVGRLAIPITY